MLMLTLLERQELLDHFEERPDLYVESNSLWVRMADDTAAMAIQVGSPPPGNANAFTLCPVLSHPAGWDQAQAESSLLQLVSYWTSYGVRMQVAKLLEGEAGLSAKTSSAAALVIASFYGGNSPEPELPPVPTALPDLLPETNFDRLAIKDGPDEALYPHEGGGWTRIRFAGEMFHITASLRNKHYTGGWTTMKGYVRSTCFGPSPLHVANALFGHNPPEDIAGPPSETQQEIPTSD